MKIFRTVSLDVIRDCRLWFQGFGIPDIKVSVVKHKKFLLTPLIDYVNCLALMRCQSAIGCV